MTSARLVIILKSKDVKINVTRNGMVHHTHPPSDSPSPSLKEALPQGVAVYLVFDHMSP